MKRTNPRGRPPAALPLLLALAAAAAAASPAPAQPPPAERSVAEHGAALTFGIAAYQRGDHEEAVDWLRRATAADPDDPAAWGWLGLAHRALGDEAAAEEAFAAARAAGQPAAAAPGTADPGPLPVPAAGAAFPFGEVPRWELRLAAAYGDDSNPLRIGDGATVLLADGTVVTGAASDGFARLGAAVDLRPFAGRGGWTLAFVAAADAALYGDLDQADHRRLAAGADLAWGGDPAGYLAGPLGYARVPYGRRPVSVLLQARWVDDELGGDAWRSALEAAGSLTVREGAAAATVLSAAWSDADYDDDGTGPQERSGSEVSAAADQLFYLGRRDRFFSLGATWRERDAGEAFAGSATGGRAALALPFGRRASLQLSGAREQLDFDGIESNPSFFGDRPREDETTRLGATLAWAATDRLLLHLGGSWSERDTTLGPAADAIFDLDYDRTTVSAGVTWYLLGGGGR
jgi:hypothetical protein